MRHQSGRRLQERNQGLGDGGKGGREPTRFRFRRRILDVGARRGGGRGTLFFFESSGQWSNLSSYGMALPISPLSAVGTTTSSCAATCHEPCGHTTRCNTPSRTPQGDGMCQHRHAVRTTPPVGTTTPCRAPPRPSHDAHHHAASHDTACGHRTRGRACRMTPTHTAASAVGVGGATSLCAQHDALTSP